MGQLKAKLAKLRTELQAPSKVGTLHIRYAMFARLACMTSVLCQFGSTSCLYLLSASTSATGQGYQLQDGKGGGEGFEVQKYGDGRVALIGELLQCCMMCSILQHAQLHTISCSLSCLLAKRLCFYHMYLSKARCSIVRKQHAYCHVVIAVLHKKQVLSKDRRLSPICAVTATASQGVVLMHRFSQCGKEYHFDTADRHTVRGCGL